VSALAEALVAAQRRALTQLEKEFVRSKQEDDDERAEAFREALAAIGLTDRLEADSLIACLEVLRVTGGALPAEPTNGGAGKPPEKASDAQVRLVQKMLAERQQVPLAEQDIRNLTKARASQLIDAIGAGTYDPNEWDVPI
jgi:hypothetical protein